MRLKEKTIIFESKRDAERAHADLKKIGMLRMFIGKTWDEVAAADDATLAAWVREAVRRASIELLKCRPARNQTKASPP